MSRRTFSINVLREAKRQIKKAREAGELDEVEGEEVAPKRVREVIDTDALSEIKKERKADKDDFKQTKRRLSRQRRAERFDRGEYRVEWNFEPGQLVTISARAARRYSHLEEGMSGIIVECDNFSSNKNRTLVVMGPNGLEHWDASWVTCLDEE